MKGLINGELVSKVLEESLIFSSCRMPLPHLEEMLLLEARTTLTAGTTMSHPEEAGSTEEKVLQGKPDSRSPLEVS